MVSTERLTTKEEVQRVSGGTVFLDVETGGLDWRKDRLISVQLLPDLVTTVYYIDDPKLFAFIKPSKVIGHNLKFDLKFLHRVGVDLTTTAWEDTLHMHHLVDETADHSLDALVKQYFNDDYKERFWEKHENYQDAPEQEALEYACKDVWYTAKLYSLFREVIRENGQLDLFASVSRLAAALARTEILGVAVDIEYLKSLSGELVSAKETTKNELRKLAEPHASILELKYWKDKIEKEKEKHPAGKKWQTMPKPGFNFCSSKQLGDLLYGSFELPAQHNYKTGRVSVDDAALQSIEHQHPIIPKIRDLRTYEKMYSAFIEGIGAKTEDSRIYPSFNVSGTKTGRISHSEPNLGNIPSDSTWGRIRGIFIPDPDHVILSCDYDSLEVRVAAHFSQDPNLLRIIYEGISKHDITATALGVDRGVAKTCNFAMQYRCEPFKLSQIIGCSQVEAKAVWDKYWSTYAGEDRVYKECSKRVDAGLPIISPFGRRRHFPKEFFSRGEKKAAYRQAYSALIQGTGSDLTSHSAGEIDTWLRFKGYGRLWITVHDEILVIVKNHVAEESSKKLVDVMQDAGRLVKLSVPLVAKCNGPMERWRK